MRASILLPTVGRLIAFAGLFAAMLPGRAGAPHDPQPDAVAAGILRFLSTELPVGILNKPFPVSTEFALKARGGGAPYVFSVQSGSLPEGLTLNPNGTFTGTPYSAGNYALVLRVTDVLNAFVDRPFQLLVTVLGAPADWTPRGVGGAAITKVATSPSYATDDTLFAAGLQGELFRSTDRGAGWSRSVVYPLRAGAPIADIELSPVYDQNSSANAAVQTIFVYSIETGVWKSENRGVTFSAANNGLPCYGAACAYYQYGGALAISPAYATDGTLFLVFGPNNLTGFHEIYKSADRGANWTLAGNITDYYYGYPITEFTISPNFAADQTLMVTVAGRVTVSPNAGGAWAEIFPGLYNAYAFEAVFSPDYATDLTILVQAGGTGIFRSSDGGETFSLNSNFYASHLTAVRRAGLAPLWYMIPYYASGTEYELQRSDDYCATSVPLATLSFPAPELRPASQTGLTASAPRAGGRPDLFFYGVDAGLYSSYDDGFSFNARGLRLSAQDIRGLGGSGSVLIAAGRNGWYRSGDGGGNWTRLVTLGLSYDLAAVAPTYATDKMFLLQHEFGGVYRSTDDGASLTPVSVFGNNNQFVFGAGFNIETGRVYAAGNGLQRSDNAGADFSLITTGGAACDLGNSYYVRGVAAAADGATLFAAPDHGFPTYGGLCKSVNDGLTWTQLLDSGNRLPPGLLAVAPGYSEGSTDPKLKTVLLSGYDIASQQGRLYRSQNGGATWTQPTGFPGGLGFGLPVFSPNYYNDGTVFIVTGHAHNFSLPAGLPAGLWRSSDFGNTFAPLGAGDGLKTRTVTGLQLQPGFDGGAVVNSIAVAVTAGGGVWRSTDGGRSFAPVDGYKFVSDFLNVLIVTPAGILYAGTQDQGVFRSADGGETYSPFSVGLPASADVRALVESENGNAIYAAVAGRGLWTYNGSQWQQVPEGGNGAFTGFTRNGTTLYAARADGPSLRSNDNGLTWQEIDAAQADLVSIDDAGGPVTARRPGAVSAGLWAVSGAGGPRYSTDAGAAWITAPGGNDYALPPAATYKLVKAMGINPDSGGREVLVGTSGALYRSLDGGDTWRNVSAPGSGLEATSKLFSAVLTSPTTYGTTDILVGATGATNGGVYLSGDGGEHWTQVNQGFDPANLSISSLARTSCSGCPVQYYSGTYGSGVYTRTITVNAPPVISGWCFGAACTCGTAAGSGPEQGGTPFKLCGTGFQAGAAVEFDGVPVYTNYGAGCSLTAALINCPAGANGTPPHAPGSARIRVRNPDTRAGSVSQTFAYVSGTPRPLNSLRLAKSGGNAALTWSCPSCTLQSPARIYRAQNGLFTVFLETYNGGTGGSYTNLGAISSTQSYFWRVE